jgi:pimeloyl-ACP methyl ester carboxylesterase
MAPLAEALGVVARMPDMPGHGAAAPWPPDTSGDYFDACLAALGEVPEDADLVGHSFGAVVALRAALDMPGRVRSVTLIEPVLFAAMDGAGRVAHEAEMRPFAAALGTGDMTAAAEAFHRIWGEGRWAGLPARAREALTARIHLIPISGGALVEDAKGLLPRLAASRTPLLHVSRAPPPAVTEAIRDGLLRRRPDMRLAEVAGAGHLLAQTHPEAVASAIRDFWADLPGPAREAG